MPVELRKRKAVEPPPAPPAKKKSVVTKVADKVKAAISSPKKESKAASTSSTASVKATVGNTIDLSTFGGEIETNDGKKTTLKQLVDESKAGVVLFTYPRASTPGCTKQACLFRDSYTPLTATGYSIYGLSTDSPKANTTFQTKQKLPYPLLCDPSQTLISAIGMKNASKTTRGVFVVDKSGKVLAAEPGGPDATVAVVKKLVGSSAPVVDTVEPVAEGTKVEDEPKPANGVGGEAAKENVAKADVAAQVADTAEKLDSNGTPAV